MTEMYINTDIELKIGQIELGQISTPDGYRPAVVKCIRKAELNEYLEFVEKHDLSHLVRKNITKMHFYLVQILD